MFRKHMCNFLITLFILPLFACGCFANDKDLFNEYMQHVREKVKQNWKAPKMQEPKSCVVIFWINKSGEVWNRKILTSSGDNTYDNLALKAIDKSNPFNPLPKEFEGNSVTIDLLLIIKC